MSNQVLQLKSSYAKTFAEYQKSPKKTNNLFVINHLGQLRQMEALVNQKKLKNNLLVVLYTQKNLQVPTDLAGVFSTDLFKQAIFVELPKNNHQPNIRKLYQIAKIYQFLVVTCACKALYVNSFEGHYSILLNISKAKGIQTILVEEGTATYKIGIMHSDVDDASGITYRLMKSSFMQTIGETQLFKQGIKIRKSYQKSKKLQNAIKEHNFSLKDVKKNWQLLHETKNFWLDIWSNPGLQKSLISFNKHGYIHYFYEPFTDFDIVYACYTKLLKNNFSRAKLEYFFAYQDTKEVNGNSVAQTLVNEFEIGSNDILYLSQRYSLDLRLLMYSIERILRKLRIKGRIFIKLHPKENEQTLKMYKAIAESSDGKFIVLSDYKFSAEDLVALSDIQMVVGITSSALMYVPLINSEVEVISIANVVCRDLAKQQGCEAGVKMIAKHAKILQQFDAIKFI